MTITATLPPPPITADDIERAAARTSYNPITREIFEFPAQSSLPRLDGLTAADAAGLIEQDRDIIASGIIGPPLLPLRCYPCRQRRSRNDAGELATRWYIIPENPGRAALARCAACAPPGPARHWYGNGRDNLNAQAAVKILSMMQAERRGIRPHIGDDVGRYYQARLDIARPHFYARLTLLNGGAYHIPEPPAALPPLNDGYDDTLLWLARGDSPPPPVPVAAAEQAGVDDLPGNRTAPASIASRIRAAFTR